VLVLSFASICFAYSFFGWIGVAVWVWRSQSSSRCSSSSIADGGVYGVVACSELPVPQTRNRPIDASSLKLTVVPRIRAGQWSWRFDPRMTGVGDGRLERHLQCRIVLVGLPDTVMLQSLSGIGMVFLRSLTR
jgi:hypothetical protein